MSRLVRVRRALLSGWLVGGWAISCAAAPPLDASAIREAAAYSASHGGIGLIVEERGTTRHRSGKTKEPHHVRSITKSLWALAVLRAADEGVMRLDQRAGEILPEWRDGRGGITVRQLLDMTGGLDPANARIYGRGVASAVRGAMSAELLSAPGSGFRYGPAGYEILGEIFRRKTGLEPLDYIGGKVLRPGGIGEVEFTEDRSGRVLLSAGAHMTAEQMMALGRIILRDGRGTFGRPVVSAASLRAALTGSRANPAYGCGFWLNRDGVVAESGRGGDFGGPPAGQVEGGGVLAPSAPADLVVLLGSGGQRVYASKSRRLVIARLGEGEGFEDAEFWKRLAGGDR